MRRAGIALGDRPRAKKNELKPHRKKYWVIPPDQNGEFVAAMEDVLEVYHRPYDDRFPVVCMDETSKQLVAETRIPIPIAQGRSARFDYEYARNGVANIFMLTEPLRGWRWAKVTQRRTRTDWALAIQELLDVHYPQAEKVVLVMDNLNTHTMGSLYEAFEPTEARRLAERLEIHYTPKHGSWLNIAETELSVLAMQCLDRRIPTMQDLVHEVHAWEGDRNNATKGVDWQFTTDEARVKLRRLYPQVLS